MDSSFRKLTTKEKALKINLDEKIYGTFAEIGAGQETAAHFFKAGGASGTIAKTMSAYDMTFSDAIYGPCSRYVCEPRLHQMLDKEYNLLTKRLNFRGKRTTFFAFANTVETLNFKRTNKGHGWIGIRFQLHPNTQPNDCIVHLVLNDTDALWQQQALGIVGVNLLFACYNYMNPEDFIVSLIDNLSEGRIEIDMFRLEGPDFHHVDNRLMSLKLVKNGLTQVAMFGANSDVLQPSEALYKKNVLVLRGRFRPVTLVNVDMMIAGLRQFKKEPDVDQKKLIVLSELTLNDLTKDGKIDENDFLDRVDILCSLGQNVIISNYQEYYKLATYFSQYTRGKKIGIILGFNNLLRIFDEKYYTDLNGGILQAFGELFGINIKLFVYPYLKDFETQELMTCANFQPAPHLKFLYEYLLQNGKIEDLKRVNQKNLNIISDKVLEMIQEGEEGWEQLVPHKVAHAIKKNLLFDYPAPVEMDTDD